MPSHRDLKYFGAAAAATLLGSAAFAAPALHPLFSDHAVLQRGQPIRIWGTAAPGEKLTITLASAATRVTAGKDGTWRAELPAMQAGGPYKLEVAGSGGARAGADDLLIGDVWLCSGQSNMELPLSRALNSDAEISGAKDGELRILTVPKKTAAAPDRVFGGPVSWAAVSPETIAGFSAACYVMARELRSSERVPIGAINASWGGTAIRSWMDEAASRSVGGEDADLLALYRRDPAAANRRFGERWQAWWRGRAPGEPWRDSGGVDWRPMPQIAYWENWGEPTFANFNGMVWARKTVTLTAEEARRAATLSLGVIDEMDQTWVNGIPVGNTFGWDVARDYPLPSGLLREGENVILVSLFDAYAFGGFQGPAEKLKLSFAGGGDKPLGEDWRYAVAPSGLGDPPRPPWDAAAGLSLIHNGMIAPLAPFRLKGIAWYQGETDAGMPAGYAAKLQALFNGWRGEFAAPQLPFIVVSLANYGAPTIAPRQSGWAEIRDAQRQAVARDGRAALVVAMDLGDRLDIHPANKQEVGRRLARAARALAYGAGVSPSGPEVSAARRRAGGIEVSFKGVTGQLHSWSGARALAFELCDMAQESCRYADAVVNGDKVRIADDGKPATRVRYAWGEAPVVNLYDEAPLPAGPFEVSIE